MELVLGSICEERRGVYLRKIIRQWFSFILISGIGWLIDFTVYTLLVMFTGMEVAYANMISAIPSMTFVFFLSGKKTFEAKPSKIHLGLKYLIYFGYYIGMLVIVSYIGQAISGALMGAGNTFVVEYARIIAKLLITPITVVCNFLVMRFLIEKI